MEMKVRNKRNDSAPPEMLILDYDQLSLRFSNISLGLE
jgi:hypothetical protein